MLLLSLIIFVFFKYNATFRPSVNNDSKSVLANEIHNAFKSEINSVYGKLKQFDNLDLVSIPNKNNKDKDWSTSKDIKNLANDSLIGFSNGKGPVGKLMQIRDIAGDMNINFVFWVDKNGKEIINWTKDGVNAPHGDFKNREYFKQIIKHRQYHVNDKDTSGFFLDQGISWTTGSFRSVISMKSNLPFKNSTDKQKLDSPFVAAIAFNFKSLSSVVLPTGYLFAVTNDEGKVLYHSDSTRNLNENLLNVFSKRDELKSCLDAKAPGTFSTKYWGKQYEVEVKPVNGLPYFIIIFEDAVYNESRDMEIYSFTFSMLFLFFGFLVLQLFAIFLVSSKRSFFKKQLFDTSWIGPKMSSHKEYILSLIHI